MLRAMFITVLMFIAGPCAWAGDMYLIQFNSSDYDQNRTALQVLEERGVVTRHIFPPQYAIIDALGLPERALTTDNSQFEVFSTQEVLARTNLPGDNRIAEMFRHLVDPLRSGALKIPPAIDS